MNEGKISELIKTGEGSTLEFKEALKDDIGRQICAFANSAGGRILLGVKDDGTMRGIEQSNRLVAQIHDHARNIDPPLTVSVERVGSILVVMVPEGTRKPYAANGRFYLRQGATTQQLRRDEVRDLFQLERLLLFDDQPNPHFNLRKDLDGKAVRDFISRAKISKMPAAQLLSNLGLIEEKRLRNAGVLIFCEEITRFFLSATVTCVLYQGRTKYKILDRKEYASNLATNFEEAITYLRSKLNTEYIITGGPREERLELPIEALREALLNALVHRDYTVPANVLVEIYQDRVTITNPGGLLGRLTVKELYGKSVARNPLLFGLLQRMNLVEKVGSGLLRIRKAFDDHGLPPPKIEASKGWFCITFRRPTPQKTPRKTPRKLTPAEQRVIDVLIKEPGATREAIARQLGLSPETVKEHLQKLKKKGVLIREGGRKSGYWEVR